MDIRQPNPTQAAGILRSFLKELGVEIKHMAALEAVARVNGFSDLQAMTAAQKKEPLDGEAQLVLDADGEGYTFVGSKERQRVWITIGSISAYIGPSDEGVIVDLFAKGAEDSSSLTSTYLHFQEAMDELCTSLEVEEEAVATWFGSTFSEQTAARKAELVKEFAKRREEESTTRRYVHGEWEHIFPGNRRGLVRFVFDRTLKQIVAMEVQDRDQSWALANRIQRDDVEDSLLHANPEALEDPGSEDLQESGELPDWARSL